MARIQSILILMVLCTVAVTLAQVSQGGPHINQGRSPVSQGGPHENQGRARREAENSEEWIAGWTTCDFTAIPRISCHDCHTKMICKQIGGLLKPCKNPSKPYCNNGICSAIPSAGCA